jgi:hypothetical protein
VICPSTGSSADRSARSLRPLDNATALVECSGDSGRACAVVPCRLDALLRLRTAPREAAEGRG